MFQGTAVTIENIRQPSSAVIPSDRAGLAGLVQFVKRYKRTILLSTLMTFAAASLYVVTTTPIYTASSLVIVEPKYSSWSNSVVGNLNTQVVIDSGQIESQIQLIKSAPIAGPVYRGLKLDETGMFTATPGLFSRLASHLGAVSPHETPPPVSSENINALGNMTGVRRIGQSYVIEISFAASNPAIAAKICNSITAAYIADRLKSRIEAARNGNEILSTKLSTLNEQNQQLDEAIATGDLDVERLPSADARVISAAIVPSRPSWPRRGPTLALSLVVGVALGFMIGLIRRSLEAA
jgi:uncharacterized protein involved in exopolysaccharide biosynthesis